MTGILNNITSSSSVLNTNRTSHSSMNVELSTQSILANAMEELGSMVSERRQRTKSDKNSSVISDNQCVDWLYKVQKYLVQVPDLENQNKLLSFVSANLGRANTEYEFIESLKGFSADPGLQYLAGKVLAESSDLTDKQQFEQALKAFRAQNHKAISIVLNTSSVFANHLPVENLAQARFDYRVISDYQSHSKVWRELQNMVERYGSVDDAINVHQKALSADYNALEPSCEKSILGLVMHNLSQLKQLTTVYDMVKDTALLLQHQFFISIDKNLMMEKLLTFPDNQVVTKNQLSSIMNRLKISSPDAQVIAIQELRKIAIALPDALYPTNDHRLRVISSLQDGIDSAIQKEEEWLNEQ
ncbi:TyeA family type III secretion system gatekeeper subunit [Vibrio sp. TBV020]|uniref:TyeA family type III secretion system gatekeeper subunit n=1 Tax=Vibrio sp. TBV020 TaxID=3137398 RepID=UPI0038CD8086